MLSKVNKFAFSFRKGKLEKMFGLPKYQLKDDPFSSHRLIAQHLADLSAQTILDLGCDKGFIGRLLKYQPKIMVGVDLVNLPKLKNYTRLFQADLNRLDINFLGGQKFAAIILADILEHLERPQKVLNLSLKYLEKDGSVIISVPNTGYWLVRFLYFFNIRPKTDHTIFDRTHIQDFDLKSLHAMCRKSHLKVIKFEQTAIPLPVLSQAFNQGNWLHFLYQLNFLIAKRWPDFFAYQLIVVCQKRSD